jgi:hypothetical protein
MQRMGRNPPSRPTKQPLTPMPRESGSANDRNPCIHRGLNAMQPRPVQISRPDEADLRGETDRKIAMVEAVGFAPKSATLVKADHLTRQKVHVDEAGHPIGTGQPDETERKIREIREVEAPVFTSRSATSVEGDP